MKCTEERNNLKKKKFTWDRAWARPFESRFSLLMNFCRVNTLLITEACKLLAKNPGTGKVKRVRDFYMDLNGISATDVEIIRNIIGGGAHLPKLSNKVFDMLFNCDEVRYCPECLRNYAYHSDVFQLNSVKKCPIHRCNLVTADIHRIDYVEPEKDSSCLNLANIPLVYSVKDFCLTPIEEIWNNTLPPNAEFIDIITSFDIPGKSNQLETGFESPETVYGPIDTRYMGCDYGTEIMDLFFDNCYDAFRDEHSDSTDSNDGDIQHKENLTDLFRKIYAGSLDKGRFGYTTFMDEILVTALIAGTLADCKENPYAGRCLNGIFVDGKCYKPSNLLRDKTIDYDSNNVVHKKIAYTHSVKGIRSAQNVCSLRPYSSPHSDESFNIFGSYEISPANLTEIRHNRSCEIDNMLRFECQKDQYEFLLNKFLIQNIPDYYNAWRSLPPVAYIIYKYRNDKVEIKRIVGEEVAE